MANNEDKRIRRTKKILKNEFINLLRDKDINKISIKELTEAAEVNRGTFYAHYQDILDLRDDIENDLIEECNQLIEKNENCDLEKNANELFLFIYQYILKNRVLIISLFGEHGDRHFESTLNNMLKENILRHWAEHHPNKNVSYFDYIYNFTVAGVVGLITEWVDSGFKETPEEMSIITEKILAQGVSAFIQ